MESSNETGKMIGALLIGAAIGAGIGILFAPDKGSETRKKISGKTDDYAKTLKEAIDTYLKEVQKAFDCTEEKKDPEAAQQAK